MMKRPSALLLLGLALYAAAFVFSSLHWAHQHDEGISFDLALASPQFGAQWQDARPLSAHYAQLERGELYSSAHVLDVLWSGGSGQPHPPLYYLGLNAWARLVGTGSLALRLPALLFGLASLVALRRLGRQLMPASRAGEWAALLLALSPWFVALTVFLRPYAQVLCIALWASVWALRAAERGATRRDWLAFALLSLAGIYTLYHYVFVLVWHLALLLVSSFGLERVARRARWSALGLVLIGLAAGFAPWLPAVLRWTGDEASKFHFTTGRLSWSEWPGELHALLRRFFLDQLQLGGIELVWWILLALSVPAAGYALWSARKCQRELAPHSAWLCLPLLPGTALAVDALVGNHTFVYSKYSFLLQPLLLLVLAAAWEQLPARALARTGLCAWVALLAVAGGARLVERMHSPSHYQTLAAEIARHDAAAHLFTPTVTRRGDRIALLLCLRDAGASASLLTTGGLRTAPELLGSVQALPELRRLTFARAYVPSRAANAPRIDPFVEQLLTGARAAGWQVEQRKLHELEAPLHPRGRLLVETGPVIATFFGH